MNNHEACNDQGYHVTVTMMLVMMIIVGIMVMITTAEGTVLSHRDHCHPSQLSKTCVKSPLSFFINVDGYGLSHSQYYVIGDSYILIFSHVIRGDDCSQSASTNEGPRVSKAAASGHHSPHLSALGVAGHSNGFQPRWKEDCLRVG